jgi:hypothetical protein
MLQNLYQNKIIVHPKGTGGDGYFCDSNWSRIFFQPSQKKYLDYHWPIDIHFAILNVSDKATIVASEFEEFMVDLPEFFETVDDYLIWCETNGIRLSTSNRKHIIEMFPKIEGRVVRNYRGVHLWPGAYVYVGKATWQTRYKSTELYEQHAIRVVNAKRTYQTWYTGEISKELEESFQLLRNIPDLTEKEMHDIGIQDFG